MLQNPQSDNVLKKIAGKELAGIDPPHSLGKTVFTQMEVLQSGNCAVLNYKRFLLAFKIEQVYRHLYFTFPMTTKYRLFWK